MSDQVEVKKTHCQFCQHYCGVLVHVEDGRVVKVLPNKEHPASRGYVCERNQRAVKWLYQPDQLMYPLKRVGERGEGKWQRVTWDDALGEIGEKLNKIRASYGPEALGVITGTVRGNDYWQQVRFLSLFGNPQNVFFPGPICGTNAINVAFAVIGDVPFGGDITNTNCLLIWGCDMEQARERSLLKVLKAKNERDIKIITIDPRRTSSAEIADVWLQLRPGTDAALALGWLNVIINEELYDKAFVENWTVGFDKLKERVQQFPPEKVAQITGLPRDQVVATARMYATIKPAMFYQGAATDEIGRTATTIAHAKIALSAITGGRGVFGGTEIRRPGEKVNGGVFVTGGQLGLLEKLAPEQRKKQLGYEEAALHSLKGYEVTAPYIEKVYGVPAPYEVRLAAHMSLLWPAILEGKPYPVKALITWQSNPLLWAGPVKNIYEAFKSANLDLHVVQDMFMTPSAQLADYVLPAASWMERYQCTNYMDFGSVLYGGERAIPPLGERRDGYELWRGLALSVGQRDYWPWETLEEVSNYRLNPLGLTVKQLAEQAMLIPPSASNIKEKNGLLVKQAYEETGFPTASGKVELYSSALEKLGYDPLPWYEEPAESPISTPEVAKEYPLILNTGGRVKPFFHSEWRQYGTGAREKHPDPLMDIHPDTARSLGIAEGDWAYIETRRGRIMQKARLNDGILPNVINVEPLWWFPEKPENEPSLSGLWESNANVLTLDDLDACDPLCGGLQLRALLCKVCKA